MSAKYEEIMLRRHEEEKEHEHPIGAEVELKHDYKDKPLTMGALGMWLPITLSACGVMFAILSTVGGLVISNVGRLTKVETQIEQIEREVEVRITNEKRFEDELRRQQDTTQRYCPSIRAEPNGTRSEGGSTR